MNENVTIKKKKIFSFIVSFCSPIIHSPIIFGFYFIYFFLLYFHYCFWIIFLRRKRKFVLLLKKIYDLCTRKDVVHFFLYAISLIYIIILFINLKLVQCFFKIFFFMKMCFFILNVQNI